VGGEALEESIKIFLGVSPVERPGAEVVVVLERIEPVLDVGQVVEVVWA